MEVPPFSIAANIAGAERPLENNTLNSRSAAISDSSHFTTGDSIQTKNSTSGTTPALKVPFATIPEHATCYVPLKVAQSLIPSAGRGVFVEGDVPAHTLIFSIRQPLFEHCRFDSLYCLSQIHHFDSCQISELWRAIKALADQLLLQGRTWLWYSQTTCDNCFACDVTTDIKNLKVRVC